jgi:hypothetical protein
LHRRQTGAGAHDAPRNPRTPQRRQHLLLPQTGTAECNHRQHGVTVTAKPARADPEERLRPCQQRHRVDQRWVSHHHVEAAVRKPARQCRTGIDDDLQRHLRISDRKAPQRARQPTNRDVLQHAEPHRAGHLPRAQRPPRIGARAEDRMRERQQQMPRFGELHATRRAVEQTLPQFSSSRRNCMLTAAWVRARRAAATPTAPVSATVTNARRRLLSRSRVITFLEVA